MVTAAALAADVWSFLYVHAVATDPKAARIGRRFRRRPADLPPYSDRAGRPPASGRGAGQRRVSADCGGTHRAEPGKCVAFAYLDDGLAQWWRVGPGVLVSAPPGGYLSDRHSGSRSVGPPPYRRGMTRSSAPDPVARWLSHLLVGSIIGAVVVRKAGLGGFLVTAVLTGLVHEALDAPLASVLTEVGI